MQGGVRGRLVGIPARPPEAFAVAPHVPVGKFLHRKTLHLACHVGNLINLIVRRHLFDQRVQARQNPAVQLRGGLLFQKLFRFPAVNVGVQCEERIGVAQGIKEIAHRIRHPGDVKSSRQPGSGN